MGSEPDPTATATIRRAGSGWTILAAFGVFLLLPVAVHYQRKARREADSSDGRYAWPHTIWNRPILLFFIEGFAVLFFVLAMAGIGLYGP